MLKRFLLLCAASFGISQISIAQNQLPEAISEESGYFITTELNFNKGFLHNNISRSLGLQVINGYQFNQYISAGLGIGADAFINPYISDYGLKVNNVYMPVFSDIRIYFKGGQTQPYFSQAVGYAFSVYQSENYYETKYNNEIGGVMLNPSFGVKINITPKTAFNLSLGYRYQEFSIKNIYHPGYGLIYSKWTGTAHYITLKTGLTF